MLGRLDMLRALVIGCCVLVAGTAQAQDSATVGDRPQPIGSPGSWVTMADYPVSALRAHQEGVVEFALDIGAAGRPERCTIIGSSGTPALDEAACTVLMARAAFKPLQPGTASQYRSRVAWRLLPLPTDDKGRPHLLVTFEFDRTPIRCSVTPKAERLYLPASLCKAMGGSLHRAGASIDDPVYVAIETVEQVLRRRI